MLKELIVVVGFGWVGQANALALVRDGYETHFFDIGEPTLNYHKYTKEYSKIKRIERILDKDGSNTVYVVCVGDKVSEDGIQDISSIERALVSLSDAKGTVVLRSTVLPKYLKGLDFDIYLPEFLHEKVGVEECINPFYVVVGKREGIRVPSFIELWKKRSVKQIECSPEDASHIKYLSNIWNSLRIAFINEYGCSIEEPSHPGAIARIENIMRFLFENKPYLRYGRSFGGHCLPKDTRAYTRWSEDSGKHSPLLRAAIASNEAHRQREEKYANLPEWFSEWQRPTGSGWVALSVLLNSIKRNIKHPLAALTRRKNIGRIS